MSIIDQLASHQRNAAAWQNQPSSTAWVYQQKYPYPHHEEHSRLIKAFEIASENHSENKRLLNICLVARAEKNPRNDKKSDEEQHYEKQCEITQAPLNEAIEELLAFNNHEPLERIDLVYTPVIANLRSQLESAKVSELEFRARMQTEAFDGSYNLQMEKLKILQDTITNIQSKIRNYESDVAQIYGLIAEQDQKTKTQVVLDEALPIFEEACNEFLEAWTQLKNIAHDHKLLLLDDVGNLPSGALYHLQQNPHDRQSQLFLTWKQIN